MDSKSKVVIHAWVAPELHTKLKVLAAQKSMSLQDFMELVILKGLKGIRESSQEENPASEVGG